MATGAPGTQGIWQYGEDDSEATFSALLNKVASTTNTQIGVDRGRITTAEGKITSLEGTRPGTTGKPLAWAANGVNTSSSAQVTVTFPASRFSVTPLVVANVINHPNVCVSYATNPSATSFDVGAFTIGGARVVATVWWHAVQMTSGSAAG